MKISTKGRYGLKAIVDIGVWGENGCVSLNSTSERLGISVSYLEQLVMKLRKAGYVESIRGAQGGYILNKSPADITVGDVLTVMEGSLLPVECLDDESNCTCGIGNCDTCVTKSVWLKIYDSVTDVVDSITLEDLIADYKANKNIEIV